MEVINFINRSLGKDTEVFAYYISHIKAVSEKAVEIATLNGIANLQFITNASYLHDIGILFTNAPKIGCFGKYDYICHGYLGREFLEKSGFSEYALFCERHIGVGLTIDDIEKQNLPLPKRDMVPITIEEKIVCVADKFFSKNEKYITKPKSVESILANLEKYGKQKPLIFLDLMKELKMIY